MWYSTAPSLPKAWSWDPPGNREFLACCGKARMCTASTNNLHVFEHLNCISQSFQTLCIPTAWSCDSPGRFTNSLSNREYLDCGGMWRGKNLRLSHRFTNMSLGQLTFRPFLTSSGFSSLFGKHHILWSILDILQIQDIWSMWCLKF